jgi:uncharacterized small protein (DUF1192 family)
MSDPVTNSDVEDVLSSIRRLVSENQRAGGEPVQAQAADRLVLTPQLRVSQDDVLRLEPEHAVEPDDETEAQDRKPAAESGEDPQTAEVRDAEAAIDPASEPLAADAADTESWTDTEPADSEDLQIPEHRVVQRDTIGVFELSAKIAALETAIGRTADQWEPDGKGRDAYAGTDSPTISWQSNVELDGTGRPLPVGRTLASEPDKSEPRATEPEPEQENVEVAESDDQFIDEDALRELVADIVKSELQGKLGERITRNVRKLVRREIQRALAARELE